MSDRCDSTGDDRPDVEGFDLVAELERHATNAGLVTGAAEDDPAPGPELLTDALERLRHSNRRAHLLRLVDVLGAYYDLDNPVDEQRMATLLGGLGLLKGRLLADVAAGLVVDREAAWSRYIAAWFEAVDRDPHARVEDLILTQVHRMRPSLLRAAVRDKAGNPQVCAVQKALPELGIEAGDDLIFDADNQHPADGEIAVMTWPDGSAFVGRVSLRRGRYRLASGRTLRQEGLTIAGVVRWISREARRRPLR